MLIKESLGAEVTALTMGPPAAKEIIYEAFTLGVDKGVLLSDMAFAGADVLATSKALSECISLLGYDLIICGKQTTDGDTAQVGPAVAEYLNIPHVCFVKQVSGADNEAIRVLEDMTESVADLSIKYPCLITVEASANRPRLPSYVIKQKTKNNPIQTFSLQDLSDKDKSRYGMLGSPTSVERIFTPESNVSTEIMEGDADELSAAMLKRLKTLKFV